MLIARLRLMKRLAPPRHIMCGLIARRVVEQHHRHHTCRQTAQQHELVDFMRDNMHMIESFRKTSITSGPASSCGQRQAKSRRLYTGFHRCVCGRYACLVPVHDLLARFFAGMQTTVGEYACMFQHQRFQGAFTCRIARHAQIRQKFMHRNTVKRNSSQTGRNTRRQHGPSHQPVFHRIIHFRSFHSCRRP